MDGGGRPRILGGASRPRLYRGEEPAFRISLCRRLYFSPAALASELAALNVDVIVTHSSGVHAARQATSTIPIVAATAGDIVASRLVSSLAHPGGNITGLTNFAPELLAKRLQMLKDIAPSLARAGLLLHATELRSSHTKEVVRVAAEALKVELFVIEASGRDEFESAFTTCDDKRIGGLVSSDNTPFATAAIAALAATRRLPSLGSLELAKNGGLAGYGVDFARMYRRAAIFVDKILKGADPGDLPIERATKFRTIVNLKTAKSIGIDIPLLLLARRGRGDRVTAKQLSNVFKRAAGSRRAGAGAGSMTDESDGDGRP